MKKNFKLVLALVLSVMMILGSVAALANEQSQHTITINNTDQNVSHSYEAYQVFVGKLDAGQTKLSDIQWGSGVNGDNLLNALKADTTYGSYFTNCTTAAKVAEVLGATPFVSTNGDGAAAGAIDSIASIISQHLTSTKADFTEAQAGKSYTASVTGDGYYFIKDTTTTLTGTNGSDTKSKFLLAVVKDTSIAAKDTHLTPDKEILKANGQSFDRVKQDTAAVGDTVTFEVTIPVPDTKKYQKGFVFDMQDKLPVGMTFMGITSVKVGNSDVPYTLTVAERSPAGSTTYGDFASYTAPADAAAAVTTAGGQKIKLDFTNFKANAEAGNWIGNNLVVTYTAVVNDDADFTPTGNENEVWFDYSNDPNSDYTGDNPTGPIGETPHDKTKTFLINLEIDKTGDNGATSALEGAEFEITSSDYNVTLVTGERYVEDNTEGTYYQLKDGSYTTTAPTDDTASMYTDRNKKYKKESYTDSLVTPGSENKVTVITGANGKIVLKGLKPGTYSVKETKAPTGYNLDPNTYTLKVNWTYNDSTKTGAFEKDNSSSAGVTWDGSNAKVSITIDNKSGSTLPSTGGIGTTIFYIAGSILVLAAAILLITKRRMGNND